MENIELIVLHTTKYGENSVILHALTKEYGRKGFIINKPGRKTASSFLLPLNILEADIQTSRMSSLITARGFSAKYPLSGIRENISKNAMSMFISEVLYRVVKDGTLDMALYGMCERNILLLNALEGNLGNFHLWFLIEFISVLGFGPTPDNLRQFLGEESPVVEKMLKFSFPDAMLIPLTGERRNYIAGKLLKYIEFHTESAVNVNSLDVLGELFRTTPAC